jgi:hypothetical protein
LLTYSHIFLSGSRLATRYISVCVCARAHACVVLELSPKLLCLFSSLSTLSVSKIIGSRDVNLHPSVRILAGIVPFGTPGVDYFSSVRTGMEGKPPPWGLRARGSGKKHSFRRIPRIHPLLIFLFFFICENSRYQFCYAL